MDVEIIVGYTRADEMQRAERNDRGAQRVLRPFPRRERQRAAAEQRPQGDTDMKQQRAVEQDLSRQALPDIHEPDAPCLERAQRDEAQRVVEQMRGDVGEKDVARPEAQASDHGTTSTMPAPLRAAGRSRPSCPRPRSAAAAGSDAGRSPWRCLSYSCRISFS